MICVHPLVGNNVVGLCEGHMQCQSVLKKALPDFISVYLTVTGKIFPPSRLQSWLEFSFKKEKY